MKMLSSYDKLLQYALRITTRKRYTVFEMRNKLTNHIKKYRAIKEEHIKPVIERLIDLKYLDDGQFIQDYISERVRLRPRGRILLMRELRFKGISKDLIESAFEEVDIDEFKIALELLSKRIARWSKYPFQKQKMKAYQLLYSRGFKGDAIYRAIESCYNIPAE